MCVTYLSAYFLLERGQKYTSHVSTVSRKSVNKFPQFVVPVEKTLFIKLFLSKKMIHVILFINDNITISGNAGTVNFWRRLWMTHSNQINLGKFSERCRQAVLENTHPCFFVASVANRDWRTTWWSFCSAITWNPNISTMAVKCAASGRTTVSRHPTHHDPYTLQMFL